MSEQAVTPIFKIERGVGIPPKKVFMKERAPLTIALLQMKPGDSVFVPVANAKVGGHLSTAKKRGMRVTTRTEGAGTRVWCLVAASR